ncbi:OLC1v1015835C1 [Oldenlandia corymbosa var. corymbosa]|uniref:OLC1v1015835C1 n=1 Tax=Oldenlandia corymbosa var. corymbosa TaxID=529605 RepID=A0AAV1E707_OLDCO|nr:OLC1v1015835C1 [Oldenlandia corymbosa var. corymbosa]
MAKISGSAPSIFLVILIAFAVGLTIRSEARILEDRRLSGLGNAAIGIGRTTISVNVGNGNPALEAVISISPAAGGPVESPMHAPGKVDATTGSTAIDVRVGTGNVGGEAGVSISPIAGGPAESPVHATGKTDVSIGALVDGGRGNSGVSISGNAGGPAEAPGNASGGISATVSSTDRGVAVSGKGNVASVNANSHATGHIPAARN